MKHNRRSFIKQSSLALGSVSFSLSSQNKKSLQQAIELSTSKSPTELAEDEAFWSVVQQSFTRNPRFINLENGYYSCLPQETLNAQIGHIQRVNEQRSYYMRNHQVKDRENVKRQLADFAGCSLEELIITRNTTESLNTIVFGLDFKKGEEAILCDQDYGSMQEQFKQQAQRYGLKLKWVKLPLHPKSDEEIVAQYEAAITPNTRILLVSHIINISGQVLPVRKIADMAHSHGVEVLCDGAHSFGHLNFNIPDLGVDYFGTSMHKWLCCPLGTGLLYIKKDKIPSIWPLFGDVGRDPADIRKLEHIGTQPSSTHLAIVDALNFQHLIGSANKEARLRYLRNYWIDRVKDLPHIEINSPFETERSCGIGNVAVKGMPSSELAKNLWEGFQIYTVAINRESVKGIRVTPHLYTTLDDLKSFVEALTQLG